MDSLETLDAGVNAMQNVSDVTLVNLPNLVELCLDSAFLNVKILIQLMAI